MSATSQLGEATHPEGLEGERELLVLIREAIVACTDRAFEADVPKAAEALLSVLQCSERRDSVADLAMFIYYIWRRVARYGFDHAAPRWKFYLFNGSIFRRGQSAESTLNSEADRHIRAVVRVLASSEQLRWRARRMNFECNTSDFIEKAIVKAHMLLKNIEQLAKCGLPTPDAFEREMDMGSYIGFKNGVYDLLNDRFMPRGAVPLDVLVSMSTEYDYVAPDHPSFPEKRAQIDAFYRSLFADDHDDANDARLAAMWLFSGSLLCRENVCKKAYVFLGKGENGTTTFTSLLHRTLGEYAEVCFREELGEGSGWLKPLVCMYPEGTELPAFSSRTRSKPIVHTRSRPADASWRWVAEFKSTFVPGLEAPDFARRHFRRDCGIRDTMVACAPFHFLMMLEAHRAFRAVGALPELECEALAQPSAVSSVYAFATPSMPGMVKIGATDRDVAERLRDANASDTWRPPEPYAVVCSVRVEDAFATERAIHEALSASRVHPRREFFRISVEEVRAVFALYGAQS